MKSRPSEESQFYFVGGAFGPNIFTHVKCQNCNTEYNGKTGKSNQQNIIIYIVVSLLVIFCACSGFALLGAVLSNQ